ncbi:SusC/RagA family TonB-linked outer membrane protein [Pedobacter gandavensis]|uniref:SusC/RagA family TonB-linked outer membrane protein n=1 Tax=Pedobacter gandavensis TaxID=2679963 RepID=UPI00292CEF2E|nr:SusC/RagA family TonB-linked outer membrane protein [Pedobacter gandavensis]
MYNFYPKSPQGLRRPAAKFLLIMKLTTLLLITSILQVSATSYAQRISLSEKNTPLRKVFDKIRSQSGYDFLFTTSILETAKPVNIKVSNMPLDEVLNAIFIGQPLKYAIEDKSVIVKIKEPVFFEKTANAMVFLNLVGKVVDDKGAPLPGATVAIKGTQKKALSDGLGSFKIVAVENDLLVISMMGYETREFRVGTETSVTITLKESSMALEGVIVTALGLKREEKSLGYAVQKVQGGTLNSVKGVDVATSLTGKVAGLNIKNSTEFNEAPSIKLRGADALLVVDGVPYYNVSLRDIPADDIESIDVLKGATASALYGNRGGNGAIMVTTKRGNKEGGLDVSFNSSSMFSSGFLAFPEVQTAYSSGGGGKYGVGDYVWGDKLDIGRTAKQYNPNTYQFEVMPLVSKGKNNLENFLQPGYIFNNNVSISQRGENGSFRASFTHVYDKGQYPNTKLNKITASMAGEMKAGKFSLDGGFNFNKRYYPNNVGSKYGGGGYMYNLVVWSGSEYDVREFKNYWVDGKENVMQNWMENSWYDNPYFIANEILHGNDYNIINGYVNASYELKPWMKVILRSGMDNYSSMDEYRNAISAVGGWNKKGYYSVGQNNGFSTNNDLIVTAKGKFGDFQVDGLVGGSLFYSQSNGLSSTTANGISIPGFYSLAASVDPATTTPSIWKKQVNSLYSKLTLSYKNFAFLDVTGRNDWSSSLSQKQRSYFYPSVAGSFVFSELINLPEWIDMAKVRGAWTQTKKDPNVYEINNVYTINPNVWNGASSSNYPNKIRGADILPQTNRTYEIGGAFAFLKNTLRFDATYFNNLYYNRIDWARVSSGSGFNEVLVNTQEELVRKGMELTLDANIIRNKDFSWSAGVNWSTNRIYYAKLDPVYSSQKQWVKEGSRYDWTSNNKWDTSPDGQPILQNGLPVRSPQESVLGYTDPDWIWGINNTFNYKNFTLAFSFDGRVGGTSYSNTVQALWNSGAHIDSDNSYRYDEVVNGKKSYVAPGVTLVSGTALRDVYGNITSDTRVFAPNTTAASYEAYIKKYHSNAYTGAPQNYFLQTFFKLRELSLTYALPRNLVKSIGMRNASVGFVGQNMLLWTKEWKYADPDKGEDNLNSPSVRYMGFNVKVNF